MKTENLRILVVDDSSMAIRVTVELLEQAGHQVEGKVGSDMAIDRIRKVLPDIVISDVMMPGINGFELLNMIREDDSLESVRVIMASAKAFRVGRYEESVELSRRSIATGRDDFDSHNNLGNALSQTNAWAEAIAEYAADPPSKFSA